MPALGYPDIFGLMNRLLVFICAGLFSAVLQAAVDMPPPQLAAKAWILLDASTGFVMAEHAADERLPPASLTKLMTGYVLAHELSSGIVSDDDSVLISETAWSQNPLFVGSSLMWIEAGKRVTLRDLHRGMVIVSGNDATLAIAEHLAGSDAAFAEMMNAQALALGMQNSHFVNSHGLTHPDHYTSARDLARLASALIEQFPEQYALYREPELTYNDIRQHSRNSLLAEDPSVDGLKTGYTEAAGYCLAASAKRDGMRLISVVLGSASARARAAESRRLLNYGFRNYQTFILYPAGHELAVSRLWRGRQQQLRLGTARRIALTVPRGRRDELAAVIEIDKGISAPVEQGSALGTLRIALQGETLLDDPLVALESVAAADFWGRLVDGILLFFSRLFDV